MVSEDFYLINLKKYAPRHFGNGHISMWNKVPVGRRSLVFILLFLGKMGELRVILTKRSSKLRTFPGHISLPGGKADLVHENEWQVARREMEEEIGLSADNATLSRDYGFQIDHLNTLPCYLSRTFSVVKPCIGFMNYQPNRELFEDELIQNIQMNLNPGESSSIFSCPLKDFLYPNSEAPAKEALDRHAIKVEWGRIPWHLRSYTFPQNNPHEAEWLKEVKDLSELELCSASPLEHEELPEDHQRATARELRAAKKNKLSEWGRRGSRRDSLTNEKIYDVWGLTANILHDLAVVTYSMTPATEETTRVPHELGEEELIYLLWKYGNQLQSRVRSAEERQLISATSSEPGAISFSDVLPRTEFNRLVELYK